MERRSALATMIGSQRQADKRKTELAGQAELERAEEEQRQAKERRHRAEEKRAELARQREVERAREEQRQAHKRRQRAGERRAESNDPMVRAEQAGDEGVLLCNAFNVWIDRGILTWMQRFFDNPRELTRRLLKELVGEDNLGGICARGRSQNTRPVPQETLDIVEDYVNKRCNR
ncbi:hypothetical protein QAD02_018355 [Eretmocerus hayati]|uniref:Uncharacterized protein n=1 Tax=Eretmocerus hayati TaxID=131215 RepID=A0ACC2PHJ6_9HYME|nr:hypothetical protein QAD02_018355 [Eretmocerus hayati]